MNDADAAAKGHRARAELDQTREAFDKLKDALVRELVGTSPSQPDKVLKLHLAIQNLTGVRQALLDMVQNGQVAEAAMAAAGLTRPV